MLQPNICWLKNNKRQSKGLINVILAFFLFLSPQLFAQIPDTIWECGRSGINLPDPSDDTLDVIEWYDVQADQLLTKMEGGIEVPDSAPFVTYTETSYYIVTYINTQEENLVPNGDFETVLTAAQYSALTDYTYRSGFAAVGPGNFGVGTSPSILQPDWYRDMDDHTKQDGTGLMYYADGSNVNGAVVYKNYANVEADKYYALSAWVANTHGKLANPHKMEFYINGDSVGSLAGTITDRVTVAGDNNGLPYDVGQAGWEQYYGIWKSTITGSVEIKYINTQVEAYGNDFAIDDIELYEAIKDTVVLIPVYEPEAIAKDDTVYLDLNLGYGVLTANDINDGSNASCGPLDSLTIDIDKFYCTDLPNQSKTVTLTAWQNGFIDTDIATVWVMDTSGVCIPIFPKGFSPDGNNVNDIYIVDAVKSFSQVTIEIMNRWGTLIYENSNFQDVDGWDGKANVGSLDGTELPVGTYYYVAQIKDNGEVYRGSIYLGRAK